MKTTTKLTIVGLASLCMLTSCERNKTNNMSGPSGGGPGKGTPGGVLLEVELPEKDLQGTPAPVDEPDLLPETKSFPEYRVPEGTILLSKGKKVTSSDDFPISGEIEYITDGDKQTADGYFVELMEGAQWVQIDLEKSHPLYAIVVWHFHREKIAYRDVIIQVSDHPDFKTGVKTLYNNDYDDSSGMGKGVNRPYIETNFGMLVNGQGTNARYVRLYSNGNSKDDANHYIEVEVYGTPE